MRILQRYRAYRWWRRRRRDIEWQRDYCQARWKGYYMALVCGPKDREKRKRDMAREERNHVRFCRLYDRQSPWGSS